MILLGTVVLSELRKRNPSPKVLAWLEKQQADQLFITLVSLGEIERGIAKVCHSDAAFAKSLAIWLEDTMLLYSHHVLPVTAAIARRWGRLSARLGHDGAGASARGCDAQRAPFQAERCSRLQSVCSCCGVALPMDPGGA